MNNDGNETIIWQPFTTLESLLSEMKNSSHDARRETMSLLQVARVYVHTMQRVYFIFGETEKRLTAERDLSLIDATIKRMAILLQGAE